jgi:hypothetical protein
MKPCSTCYEEKPLTEYYRSITGQDGYRAKCRACCKKINDIWRAKNREEIREYDRQRSKLPHRIKARNRRTIASYKKDKHKFKVRSIVRLAIKSGKLIKPDNCSACGATEIDIEAHHNDYCKPLEVTWFCRPCHLQTHRDLGTFR